MSVVVGRDGGERSSSHQTPELFFDPSRAMSLAQSMGGGDGGFQGGESGLEPKDCRSLQCFGLGAPDWPERD